MQCTPGICRGPTAALCGRDAFMPWAAQHFSFQLWCGVCARLVQLIVAQQDDICINNWISVIICTLYSAAQCARYTVQCHLVKLYTALHSIHYNAMHRVMRNVCEVEIYSDF